MSNYDVGDSDRAIRLETVEQPGPSAHPPLLFNEQSAALLAYDIDDGSFYALIEFWGVREFRNGYGNDGIVTSHPLRDRGLQPNGVFEVRDSAWVRAHEAANSTTPLAEYLSLTKMRHFAVTTSASVFECLAARVELVAIRPNDTMNSMDLLQLMAQRLQWDVPDI